MADESTSYDDVLSRRRFVELAGVTGAAALAGCDGSDGSSSTPTEDGTSEGTESGEMEVHQDVTHEGATTANPSNIQFNPFNTSNQPEIAQHLLFEKYAQYKYTEGEFQPATATDWEFTGDTFEMQLREDLVWSNGDEFNAEDVVTQFRIAEYDGDAVFEWADSVEADGDYTVVFTVAEDVNPQLVESDVLDRLVQAPRAVYGERLEALDNGDSEIADVRGFEDTEPVTNGPFTIANRDESALLTERFGDHPDADGINFGEYAFTNFAGNQQRSQALLNLNVDSDYSLTVQSDTVADFPDAVEEIMTPDVFGLGLAPNFDDPIAGDRAIRQAISYVINRQRAVDNSYARVKQAPEVMTPISTQYQEDWLGDEMSNYETYGVESSMTEEATSVLEDAGYTVSDGTVEDEDGNQVVLEISTPGGWGDWTLPLETAVQELNDFGFDARLDNPSDYFTAITNPDDWQFIANTWLHGGPTPYPYYSLLHALHEPQQHAAHTNYPAYAEQYGGSGTGSDGERTVPARGGDGEMTMNPATVLGELAAATDEETITEHVRDLAWLANHDLPRIPIMEKQLQQWVTSDEWDVPDDLNNYTEANVEWASTWLPRQGDLQYSG